ncbi:MAG: hypothetical protein U9R39_10705 [Campylobacterota bacterium]|nr:hypothetical protein [Campylobacterota bacterium]
MRVILSLIYVPIIFFSLKYFNSSIEEVLILKALPLIISSVITILMISSYIKKNSIILYFAKKFSKVKISEKEKIYIHNSTKFWIFISMINITIHFIIFINTNSNFWLFYSSIGWYLLFISAGILQFLHRKFVFLKRIEVEN